MRRNWATPTRLHVRHRSAAAARLVSPSYNHRELSLAPGTRLGPYEVTAQIGEGGRDLAVARKRPR
jgi:hypothetical protein